MTIRNLDALLKPRSVALIGASPKPGSVGNIVTRNMLRAGFKGAISLVNPKHAEIEGQRVYPTIGAIGTAPDLAIVAAPAPAVPAIMAEVAAAGTLATVIISAGLNAENKQAILDLSRPTCLRIQGPNCLGLMLPGIGLDASFSHRAPAAGDLAFLSQSGALITAIVDWASARGIGFSHVVSLGDMLDVDFGDLIDYLALDPKVRAILLYVENITHAPKFMSAARRAARTKPVVVIKSGRHAAGAKAARSHTGALAGSDAAYDAAFRRAGVLRVQELEQLFDAAETLSRVPRLTGDRLTVLTNGGGAGVLAADRLTDWGGSLATLTPETRAALDQVLPPHWSKSNPVDIIGDALPDRYAKAVEVLIDDTTTDAILVINCPTALADATDAARAVIAAAEAGDVPRRKRKPFLSVWLGDGAAEPGRHLFRDAGIPSFESAEDAVNGFMQLVRHARAQSELMATPPSLPDDLGIDKARAGRILTDALGSGAHMLDEFAAKCLLESYGIPTVVTRIARTPDEVQALAADIMPITGKVAIKILSPDITHKSDAGGVRLDLASPEEAREAATQMLARIGEALPAARIEGFTVQSMVRRDGRHELIAGMTVDRTFGPVILFGAGGTAVEVLRDTAQALPPLDLGLADKLIGETRVARLLAGYRDRPAADRAAIAMVLVRLSYMVSEHAEIREIDINPLLADETGVIAVDARVRIADPVTDPRTPMSIKPYPSEWEKHVVVPPERSVLIRPIRPDDEWRYGEFMATLTPSDLRMRFFTAVTTLTHETIAQLTQIDYQREMAFVAIEKATGALLGVVRFFADPDFLRGEFAIIVSSKLKGTGLGRMMMSHLIAYARAEGLERLEGSVLAENEAMLRFCQKLGFSIHDDPDDAGVRIARMKFV